MKECFINLKRKNKSNNYRLIQLCKTTGCRQLHMIRKPFRKGRFFMAKIRAKKQIVRQNCAPLAFIRCLTCQINTKKSLKQIVLSSFPWSEWGDLNSRPLGPEPSALPAALHPESFLIIMTLHLNVKSKVYARKHLISRLVQIRDNTGD